MKNVRIRRGVPRGGNRKGAQLGVVRQQAAQPPSKGSHGAFRKSFKALRHADLSRVLRFVKSSSLEKMRDVLAFSDEGKSKREKKSPDPMSDMLLTMTKTARSFLNPGYVYRFSSGAYYQLQNTTAGVVRFSTINGSSWNLNYIPLGFNSQTCPESSYFVNIFDEIKVMGVDFHFWPNGRYQSGSSDMFGSSQSKNRPVLLALDDDTTAFTPTNSYSALSGLINRNDSEFKVFIPSDPFSHVYFRPGVEMDYPWVNFQSPTSTDPAWRGCIALDTGGGEVTGSTIEMGEGYFKFHCLFRLRI